MYLGSLILIVNDPLLFSYIIVLLIIKISLSDILISHIIPLDSQCLFLNMVQAFLS